MNSKGLGARSLFHEVGAGVAGRAGRSLLTGLGIAIGVAALIATIGISQSAGARIVTRFFETQATFLTVSEPTGHLGDLSGRDASALNDLPGVRASAHSNLVSEGGLVRARAPSDSGASLVQNLPVLSTDTRLLETIGAEFKSGRAFDQGHVDRAAAVAVLGIGAAERLGIASADGYESVWINGQPLIVVGIVDDVSFYEMTLNSVVLPESTSARVLGEPSTTDLLVDTDRNATYTVAGAVPALLDPTGTREVQVSVPAPPPNVSEAVGSDLDALTVTLATVGALVAAISVAAIMMINVVERIPEIGLRRALGASRRQIAVQFLLESISIGLLGGLFGVTIGLAAVTAAATVRGWTPVMSFSVPFVGMGIGVLIGILAGVYPAIKASRVSPSTSLRA